MIGGPPRQCAVHVTKRTCVTDCAKQGAITDCQQIVTRAFTHMHDVLEPLAQNMS